MPPQPPSFVPASADPTPVAPGPPNPSQTSSRSRLQQISAHMSPAKSTVFQADVVPKAPEDPLFGLMAAYRADTFPQKVDLGIGAYRDDSAKPWVLPVVKKASSPCPSPAALCVIVGADWKRSYRPTRSSAMTPSSTTSTCPSRACPSSPLRRRS